MSRKGSDIENLLSNDYANKAKQGSKKKTDQIRVLLPSTIQNVLKELLMTLNQSKMKNIQQISKSLKV